MLAKMIVRGIAGFTRTRLVLSANAELIYHLLLETFNFSFRSRVGGFHNFDPVGSEFVLYFDDVVGDRSATVALWFFPLQRHADIVVVENFWLARLARLIYQQKI